jgi:hypothetical protein
MIYFYGDEQMNYGMLWFDNDPKMNIAHKVQKAADYYQRKYRQVPNLCLVNPAMLDSDQLKAGTVTVEASAQIQPNHFWLGCQTDE